MYNPPVTLCNLKKNLTTEQIQILRDIYIFKRRERHIDDVVIALTKSLIYSERKTHRSLYRTKFKFDELLLQKKVWQDFLTEEREKGKNSLIIATEIHQSLAIVNSYF